MNKDTFTLCADIIGQIIFTELLEQLHARPGALNGGRSAQVDEDFPPKARQKFSCVRKASIHSSKKGRFVDGCEATSEQP